MVVKEKITLISQYEAPDSKTSTQEAEQFLQETPDKKANISAMNEDEVVTEDLVSRNLQYFYFIDFELLLRN